MTNPRDDSASPMAMVFRLLDERRRAEGDVLGEMVHSPWTTPSQAVLERPAYTLRNYGGADGGGGQPGRAMVLIPAPIKRPYIWDLSPQVSVVRTAAAAGWRVFLLDWAPPDGRLPPDTGLEQAVAMVAEVVHVVAEATGAAPVVAGHSLGGTLTALAESMAPGRAAGLILFEAPTAFGSRAGAFTPLISATADARQVTDALGGAPGSFLNMTAVLADRHAFVNQPFWDWMACQLDPEGLLLHLKLRRWSFDEAPLPAPLFEQVVEWLYRQDLFMKKELVLGGRRLSPRLAVPLLTVHDPRSRTVPPSSVRPLHDLSPHRHSRRLEWEWEPGVLFHHLAPLVGRKAHATLWPQILAWSADAVSVHGAGQAGTE